MNNKVHIFEVMRNLLQDEGFLKLDRDEEIQRCEKELNEFIKEYEQLVPEEFELGSTVQLSNDKVKELCKKYISYVAKDIVLTSIDYLISAASLQMVQNGEFELIIGELHPSLGVIGIYSYFYSDMPKVVDEVTGLIARYISDARVVRGVKEHKNKTACMTPLPFQELEINGRASSENFLRMGDLYLLDDGEQLALVKPDGEKIRLLSHVRIPMLDIFSLAGFAHLNFYDQKKFSPRVQIGKVIVQRAKWELDKNEVFSSNQNYCHSSVDIYIDILRMQKKYKMPNYIFYKGQNQKKPILLDFENYFLVEILYAESMNEDIFTLSEMLPDPDHLWVCDERGNYTSEFRHSVIGQIGGES